MSPRKPSRPLRTQPGRASPVPLYQQVRRALERRIRSGDLPPGSPLPSQREICTQFDVSDITVRRALQELARDRLVCHDTGIRIIVAPNLPRARIAVVVIGFDDVRWRARSKAFGDLIGGVGLVAWQEGALLSIVRLADADAMDDFMWSVVTDSTFDGLILRPRGELEERWVDFLNEHDIPLVVVKRRLKTRDVSSVCEADREEARIATAHLLSLGRRRIGLVGPALPSLFADRFEGYEAGLRDAGLVVRPEAVEKAADFFEQDGLLATRRLLARNPELDGVLVAGSELALGSYQAIREVGRRVPQDIAVVCHDSGEYAESAQPPLTSVGHSIYDMGREAAEILFESVRSQHRRPTACVLKPRLVVRASCGAIPSREESVVPGGSTRPF